jgi:hypothetical protein
VAGPASTILHASSAGDRPWPLLDLASKLPVSRHRFAQTDRGLESPITNCLVAAAVVRGNGRGRDVGHWNVAIRDRVGAYLLMLVP